MEQGPLPLQENVAERDGPSMEGSPGETSRRQNAWRRLQTCGVGVLDRPVTVGRR